MIVRTQDVKNIVGFLEQYSVEIHIRKVKLTEEDCHILGLLIK